MHKYNLLSTRCNICGIKSDGIICGFCIDSLPSVSKYICCNKCSAILDMNTLQCGECAKYDFAFDKLYTSYSYDYPLANILLNTKFKYQSKYLELLSRLFYLSHGTNPKVDYLIPVPMYHSKYIQRKFNVSYELLHIYQQYNNTNIIHATKSRSTIAQVELDYINRIKNSANLYSINQDLTNKTVAIIDDVVTTGATVNELAKICKQNGATKVYVWCLMRSLIYC